MVRTRSRRPTRDDQSTRVSWAVGGAAVLLSCLIAAACAKEKEPQPLVDGQPPATDGSTGPGLQPGPGPGPGPDGGPSTPPEDPEAKSRIWKENQKPGTRAWRLSNPGTSDDIAGYAFEVSAPAGATIPIAVSVRGGADYTWSVYRAGYYQGLGGRLMASGGPLKGEEQAAPHFDPATTLIEARWHKSFDIETKEADGTPWPTGVYLVVLTRADGVQQYAIFVLRDDTRDAEVAVQLPTATWQAYNTWGGESLYESSRGLPGAKARRVSFDRPYIHLLGHGAGLYRYMEHPLIEWIESRGYDVEYITNHDTGTPDGRLGKHKIMVAVGHDEYHSAEAVDRFEAALDAGTSFAFLTGNTMYWAVRYEDSPTAGKNKTLVCFKELPEQDPLFAADPHRATGHFRKAPQNRPENRFLGVISNGDSVSTGVDWVVQNASHWLYAGTGLKDGDRIPGIVGFEWDSYLNTGEEPPGLVVLSNSPVDAQSGRSFHNAVVYEKGDAFLFAASTVWYNRGFKTDPRVGQIVDNALERAGAKRYGEASE